MITDKRLAEIKARNEKRTPGLWCWINSNADEGRLGRLFAEAALVLDSEGFIYGEPADGRFLAHAPLDITDLLAEVERLQDCLPHTTRRLMCSMPGGPLETTHYHRGKRWFCGECHTEYTGDA